MTRITDHFNEPILITGIPRSGTSMVAGTIARCGAWTGTTVKGLYEHIDIRENAIKLLLRGFGCDPMGVKKLPDVPLTAKMPSLAAYIRTLIDADGYRGERWAYKGCKMTLLWPLFVHAFPDAKWVIVVRPRKEVVASCMRTPFMNQHGLTEDQWHEWCEEYEDRFDWIANTAKSARVVYCNKFSADADYVEDVITRLGLTYDEDRARKWIDPDKLGRG